MVLDPARVREVLPQRSVAAAPDPQLAVHDEAGRAGGALIDGEDHDRSERSTR